MENLSFREDSPEFDHIIREVCRDNVITKKERAYLEEKAAEYFIEPDKLDRYLDNPFLGHETFKIFVDQICEDAIITETERSYIVEKAKQYNVPSLMLEKMISEGILRAKFAKDLSLDEDFYEVVLIYLFANAFDIKSLNEKYSEIIIGEQKNTAFEKKLENKKIELFNFLKKAISEKEELTVIETYNPENIFECYTIINLEVIELNNISKEIKFNKEHKKGFTASLEWEYIVDNNITAPITINYLQKKVVIKTDKSKFQTFINSLFKERDKHRGPEVDLFFENFEDFYNEN